MLTPKISLTDVAQAVLLDIERRRLSTVDMYNHALMEIGQHLDRLAHDMQESVYVGASVVVYQIQSLLDNTFSAMQSTVDPRSTVRDRLYTRDNDLRLIAYTTLRDGVARMVRSHCGEAHEKHCPVCIALGQCVGMIAAVDRVNAGKMATARTQVKAVHSGHNPHKANAVSVMTGTTTSWHVNCVTCGTVAILPLARMQAAASLAVKHTRAGRALSERAK